MQVKCPKCRFRYDVAVTPGLTEAACVCPRCGTPFTHVIHDDDASRQHVEQQHADAYGYVANGHAEEQATGITPGMSSVASGSHDKTMHADTHVHEERLDWQQPDVQPAREDLRAAHVPESADGSQQTAGKFGFFRSCFFIFFVVLLLAVLGIRSCWKASKTERINAASLSQGHTADVDGAEETDAYQTAEVDPFEEIHPGKAPSWIQGTWSFVTDYGTIRLIINGKNITETIGDKTVSGTFYYENRKLVCDFGDPNNITIYRLDTNRQQIDAGNGMMMTKE